MDRPKVAAIIQARMGSSRLPAKVLMPVAGKPILWHIVHRLCKCRTVDVVAVATSELPCDDQLVKWCQTQDVPVFRGSETNVLQRFALAVDALSPEIIIRVCGDSPMVDPQTIDRLVDALRREGTEHCTGEKGIDSIHEGFSPFTRNAFNRLLREAAEDPVAIEHITAYFQKYPERFLCTTIPIFPEHRFSGARMSIDTPSDLRFMEEVYFRMAVPAGEADVADVVQLLRDNPELLHINCHVRQKTATENTFRVLVRCDGDAHIGLGHVVRCLALAEELRDGQSVGVTFAMINGRPGIDMAHKAGFPVEIMTKEISEDAWLDGLIHTIKPHALILDVRTSLSREMVKKWRKNSLLIITIDDPSERRLEADLAFYPPVPQVKEMDWSGFTGQLFSGWEWVLLRRQFSQALEKNPGNRQLSSSNTVPGIRESEPITKEKGPCILITMGGSDPAGMTLKAVRALGQIHGNFNATIVLGQAFVHDIPLKELLKNAPFPYTIHRDVENMAQVMQTADLAIASFGGTAYELAAMGVPGIFIALTKDHDCSASVFEKENMGINLGVDSNVDEQDISTAVEKMMQNSDLLSRFRYFCFARMDGQGSKVISKKISENLKSHI
ncbi:cytidylyltransferase domain-containing protein [Desulfocicer niacini]